MAPFANLQMGLRASYRQCIGAKSFSFFSFFLLLWAADMGVIFVRSAYEVMFHKHLYSNLGSLLINLKGPM